MYGGTREIDYINANELLNSVSQEQLFFKYLGIYPEIGKKYLSPFRKDNNPGCRFVWHSGLLFFVENQMFNGKLYWSITDVIKYFKNCSFIEALNIIAREEKVEIIKKQDAIKYISKGRPDIRFTYKEWPKANLFGLSNEVLQKENVYLVTDYWTTTRSKQFVKNGIHNPRKILTIAYYFPDSGHTKLYFPYVTENKWFSNCDTSDIFGKYKIEYYSKTFDFIIITKSQKDRLILDYHFNLPSIATQNEGSYLNDSFVSYIKDKFKTVYILYDNDYTGITSAKNLSDKYGLSILTVPGENKDIYEFAKNNNLITT